MDPWPASSLTSRFKFFFIISSSSGFSGSLSMISSNNSKSEISEISEIWVQGEKNTRDWKILEERIKRKFSFESKTRMEKKEKIWWKIFFVIENLPLTWTRTVATEVNYSNISTKVGVKTFSSQGRSGIYRTGIIKVGSSIRRFCLPQDFVESSGYISLITFAS